MGNYLIFERYFWFHQEVKKGRFPNARSLAEHFELSTKTAQRNINFMRDRLSAPLEYDASRKGYYYTDYTFELPPFQTTQEEILSIQIARNLLSTSAGGVISRAINRLGKRLFVIMGNIGLTESRMDEAFSAAWTGYSPSHSETFQKIADALLNNRLIEFTYSSPGTGLTTQRQVEPHHLQYYMASWVLTSWRRLRGDWRKFFLARMEELCVLDTNFDPRPSNTWKPLIAESFGIFQGEKGIPVRLRFTPFRARWIREQVWHPAQIFNELPDGGLELSFMVSDFREVKMKILQFGADVEVLEPGELRQEVREAIKKMAKLYEIEGS